MKAFVTAPFATDQLERLGSIMPFHHEDWRETKNIFFEGAAFAERLRAEGCDVIITEADEIRKELLDLVDIKMIGTCRGSPVNVDLDVAATRGIPVFHTPARNAEAVADITLCFMLMILRHIHPAIEWVKSDRSSLPDANEFITMYDAMTGSELHGRTVGLIGFGAIGQRVARRVQAFGARVVAHDPHVAEAVFEQNDARCGSLTEVLQQADLLSLHVADVPETKNLLGPEEIAQMKPGAYFINTARAASVDADALYDALASGRLSAAALDVLWEEPVRSDDRFVLLPNVIATPHIGGASRDVITHQSAMIVDAIEAWLRGDRPNHLANPAVLDHR
ncbi:MAG TPA: hypothetical protein DCG06_11900 [Deltaproteobacteria bacterium]|nr:hypothetical protein [Deltaproteobacteria bacterium]